MREIIYSLKIGDDLISQALVQVTDDIADRLKNHEEVTLRISLIPEENENKEQ